MMTKYTTNIGIFRHQCSDSIGLTPSYRNIQNLTFL